MYFCLNKKDKIDENRKTLNTFNIYMDEYCRYFYCV